MTKRCCKKCKTHRKNPEPIRAKIRKKCLESGYPYEMSHPEVSTLALFNSVYGDCQDEYHYNSKCKFAFSMLRWTRIYRGRFESRSRESIDLELMAIEVRDD